MKMMEKFMQTSPIEDDGEIFADISDWKIMCIQRLKGSQMLIIKTYSLLYPIKRVFYLWALYDGDSIVSEPAVAPLFSNSIYTATHQKISYGKNISSFLKGEDAKALNQKNFDEQSP